MNTNVAKPAKVAIIGASDGVISALGDDRQKRPKALHLNAANAAAPSFTR